MWSIKVCQGGFLLHRFALAHNYFHKSIPQKNVDQPTFTKPKIIFTTPWKWQTLEKYTLLKGYILGLADYYSDAITELRFNVQKCYKNVCVTKKTRNVKF